MIKEGVPILERSFFWSIPSYPMPVAKYTLLKYD